jgi:hypothetical protein
MQTISGEKMITRRRKELSDIIIAASDTHAKGKLSAIMFVMVVVLIWSSRMQ